MKLYYLLSHDDVIWIFQGSEKIYEGTVVPTPTEESVMTLLGVPYRPPNERDH